MKNETTRPPSGKRVLSATAPVFKFSGGAKEVPTRETTFSFNPESKEFTGRAPPVERKEEEEEKEDKEEQEKKQEKLLSEDDLYLAALLLAGETNALPQDPSAVSITDVNNHPFNSIIIPNFWDPSEKHNRFLGNWGPGVLATTCKFFFYLFIHLFLASVRYGYHRG